MLSNLNSIIIEGNLTRDPILKTTPNGHSVCEFTVGTNRFYKNGDVTEKEVSFISIECWSKLAETCANHLVKGRGVRIVGRIKQDRWTDAEGKMQARVKVVAEHVEFKPVPRKATNDSADTDLEARVEAADAIEAGESGVDEAIQTCHE